MRGEDAKQEAMFSYVSPERRVPLDHPLRPVREMVDGILKEMLTRFARLYSSLGRPSIAPERLLRALLLQVFYSVRSERMLMEQLDYNLLFRWFVGMEMDEEVWDHAVTLYELTPTVTSGAVVSAALASDAVARTFRFASEDCCRQTVRADLSGRVARSVKNP